MSDKQHNLNIRTGTMTIPASDTVSTGTQSQVLNGLVRGVELTTPAMEDTDSTDLDIVFATGGTVFTFGTVAQSSTNYAGTIFPVFGTVDVIATAEGTQSAAAGIEYHIYYEE